MKFHISHQKEIFNEHMACNNKSITYYQNSKRTYIKHYKFSTYYELEDKMKATQLCFTTMIVIK